MRWQTCAVARPRRRAGKNSCVDRAAGSRFSGRPLQSQLGELLARLRARTGIACLFITHDLRLAGRLCDRIAVLASGALVEAGTPEAFAAGGAHPATRALVDAARG
ncbi:MAG TPA: hypothetical protein VLW85_24240 [Myxococcales bacterium]|nr:hypothetical protein [Myxococcales bacterium]